MKSIKISRIIAAVLSLALLVPGALITASAEVLPTSQCVSELKAVYTPDSIVSGTLTVECDTNDISTQTGSDELIMICLYADVEDISDPTNGGTNPIVILKSFNASALISENKLSAEIKIVAKKLTGTCAVGIQVANRGANNDWVYTIMEVPQKRLKGDHDKNGFINSNDALIAMKLAADLVDPTEEQLIDGDMNGDGKLSVVDALTLLRISAGLIPEIYYED